MKKTNLRFLLTLLSCGGFLLSSCSKEDDNVEEPVVIAPSSQGVFVTNEGQFGSSNGSLSYVDFKARKVANDLFKAANSRPLGDVVQSVGMANDKAYIVVNNSNKIEIADAGTFKSVGVINGLQLPRYFATTNNKGYVSEWVGFSGNGRVSVIDLNTNTVTKTVAVGALPDRMLVINNKLYVVNSNGNTVSVINTQTDALETSITVGDGPNSLTLDANNKLWVLCGGKKVYGGPPTYALDETASTAGSLVRVDLASNTIENTLTFGAKSGLPADLNSNATKNSFVYNYLYKVYRIDVGATSLPTSALINRDFYSLAVDPNDNTIFGADAGSFSSDGKVIRYTPAGTATDSFTVGIGPNNFLFK